MYCRSWLFTWIDWSEFASIYKQAERLAAKIVVTPAILRIAKRQQHQNYVASGNPGKCYKEAIAIPLNDR